MEKIIMRRAELTKEEQFRSLVRLMLAILEGQLQDVDKGEYARARIGWPPFVWHWPGGLGTLEEAALRLRIAYADPGPAAIADLALAIRCFLKNGDLAPPGSEGDSLGRFPVPALDNLSIEITPEQLAAWKKCRDATVMKPPVPSIVVDTSSSAKAEEAD